MNSNTGLKNIIVTINGDRSSQLNISEIDLMISGENNITENVFQSLVETNNFRGIMTFGDTLYNLDKVEVIHDLAILSRNFNNEYPLNVDYLKNLVSKAETINLIYSVETFHHHSFYSNILKEGSLGLLKRIKGVIPINDVEDHIVINPDLEEIHVYVQGIDDMVIMKSILEQYDYRAITYYIHYSQVNDDEYWLDIKGMGDIVFENIIMTLMPI